MGYTYEFGGNTFKSDRELSLKETSEMVKSYRDAGLMDTETQENQKMSFNEVVGNKELLNSYRTFAKKWDGKEFEGTDEELAKSYYERMRYFDTNLGHIGMLANQLNGDHYDEKERIALNQMFTAWENINNAWDDNMMWDAVWDYTEAAATDPFNWVGLATGGAGWGASMASKQLAGAGLRQLIKQGAIQGAKQGAIQGAVYGGANSVAQQSAKGSVGIGDGVDAAETLMDTGVATVAGATFGGTLGGVGGAGKKALQDASHVNDMWSKVKTRFGDGTKSVDDLNFDETGKLVVPEGVTEKEVLAGIHYMDILADERIVGEARQEARDTFISKLTGDKQAKFRTVTESGVPVSNDMRLERGLKLLENAGIKIEDNSNFNSVMSSMYERWQAGAFSSQQFADFNRIAINMEDMAYGRLRQAWATKDKAKLAEAWEAFESATTIVNANAKQAGSALQAHSLRASTDSLTFASILKQVATYDMDANNVGAGINWLNEIAKIEKQRNPAFKFTGKAVDAVNEFWINNILGSPITIGVNVVSSTAHMIERDVMRMGAAAMRANGGEFRLAAAETKAQFTEMHLALKYMLKALAHGEAQLDKGRAMMEDLTPSIGDRNWYINPLKPGKTLNSMSEELSLKGAGNFAMNALGNANRFVGGRGMVSTDELVKQMAFRGNLYASVLRQTVKENPNLTTKEAADIAKVEYRKLTDDYLRDMAVGLKPKDSKVKAALEEARVVTFQNDYKADPAGWVGKHLGTAAYHMPVLRQIMPFIRTPANLLSHSIERTPGLNVTSGTLRKMISSQNPQERAKAQMILNISTMFWGSAIAMSSSGMLQGGDAAGNYTKKNTLEATGEYLPYSVVAPDGSKVQIRRADPYAHYFMLMGAVSDTFRYGTPEQQQGMFNILALSTAEALLSKTTLTGAADLFEAVTDDSKEVGERLNKYGTDKLKTFMPYYRFVRDVFEDDPSLYENIGINMDNPLDVARAAYFMEDPEDPFDRKRSPIFGNEMTFLPSVEVGYFTVPGFPERKPGEDPVLKEISRLAMDVPKPPISYDGINWKDIKIKENGRRSVYDMYAEAVGKVKHPLYGNKTLYYALKDVIESPEYLLLTDNKTINLENMPPKFPGTRQIELMHIINSYRGLARRYTKQQLGIGHELNKLTNQVLNAKIDAVSQQKKSQLLAPLTNQ